MSDLTTAIAEETDYKLMDVWSAKEIPQTVTHYERVKALESQSTLSNKPRTPFDSKSCLDITPMPWYEEVIVMLTWLILFSTVLYGPFLIIFLIYQQYNSVLVYVLCACILICFFPSPFSKHACYHYLATLQLKYFSCRVIWKTTRPQGEPCIG